MTIEYAAIWRAWEFTERDMRVIENRLLWRRFNKRLGQLSEGVTGLGVAALGAMSAFQGFFRAAAQANQEAQLAALKERWAKNLNNQS